MKLFRNFLLVFMYVNCSYLNLEPILEKPVFKMEIIDTVANPKYTTFGRIETIRMGRETYRAVLDVG